MPEVGYVVTCRDLHGGVGVFEDKREALGHAMRMNMMSVKARMSGQQACQYVVLDVILDHEPKQASKAETHPGLYL